MMPNTTTGNISKRNTAGSNAVFGPGSDHVQLIIVHMDGSESHVVLRIKDNLGWRIDLDGLIVDRRGGRTTFPWGNVKSYTVVFADESLRRNPSPRPRSH
jgi:hypothetical protein